MARGLRELSSCRRPAFGFQHPQSGSQPAITPVPGDPIPFSCLLRHCTRVCTYTCRQSTKTHKNIQQIRRKRFISNCIAYRGKVVRIKASSNTMSHSVHCRHQNEAPKLQCRLAGDVQVLGEFSQEKIPGTPSSAISVSCTYFCCYRDITAFIDL